MNLRKMIAPFADSRFLRLLVFGCWYSFTNGLLQLPQNVYPISVLGMTPDIMLALRVGLRVGQWPLAPIVGQWADRFGNRPVMIVSLLIVGQGPLFYAFTTMRQPFWFMAAWICWISWVGFNVALPNLILKLSPKDVNASYIASYYAATGLCHGVSTLLGGVLFDRYGKVVGQVLGLRVDYYQCLFVFGWTAALLAAFLLRWLVRE